uniref:Thioredoxin-like domain-containing protein n=1 Tax=Trepomonas sp. PC1 TaxID=1076344 RepID=A0A146K518_9EUKA|eukprot:JAP90726.1 Thioredoxin-like domain-containing protein [Trepomonas sp. PC1]
MVSTGLPYIIVGCVMLLIFLFNLKKVVKKTENGDIPYVLPVEEPKQKDDIPYQLPEEPEKEEVKYELLPQDDTPRLPDLGCLQIVNNAKEINPGNPTLIECFGVNCGPCKAMLPYVQKMSEKFVNINFIYVTQDSIDEAEIFVQKVNMAQKVNVAVDKGGIKKVLDQLGVDGVPYTLVFDKDGDLRFQGHFKECGSLLVELNE